ncbi:hypothetical protein GCM10009117_12650 [Gangjinia marincola]|uniref:Uncharacterized protein n=1 Tax=Gangjinia marincola TaxID=578463 RepID=A0ABP3XUT7_9FLAO
MKITFIVSLFLSSVTISCQDYGKLKLNDILPKELNEISGIIMAQDQESVWAIADSKNEGVLYLIDIKNGHIKHKTWLKDAINVDWEDIASDGKETIFIADTGNNDNDRKDLTIYHVSENIALAEKEVTPKKTRFRYEDQEEYPPKKKKRHFDAEALIYKDQYFYLFTKDRSSDFEGLTRVYQVPAKPGNFEAKFITEYNLCDDEDDCFVTAADINQKTGEIVLLGYNKVWKLNEYTGNDFFSGTVTKVKLKYSSQKEGIAFKHADTLLITEEGKKMDGAKLFEYHLDK